MEPCKDCGTAETMVEYTGVGCLCRECAEKRERADFAASTDRYWGYVTLGQFQALNRDDKEAVVTTWTGAKLARIVAAWKIRHNMAGYMWAWRAVDDQGREWYGRGVGDGMCTTMRLAKGR